jgi:hypothetical protein
MEWVGGGYGGTAELCSRVVEEGGRGVMSGAGRYGSVGVRSGEVVEVGGWVVGVELLLFQGCSGCGVRVMGDRGLVGREGI